MYITGRLAILAVACAPLVALFDPVGLGLLLVNAALLGLLAIDVLLAARPRALELSRTGDSKVRLGQVANIRLRVTNTADRRWRGGLRDAWTPTAGANVAGTQSDRARMDLPGGESRVVEMAVLPTRRGDRRTDRVTLRSRGPLGLGGRQASQRCDWSVRVLPPFSSRRHLPSRLARLRDMDGRAAIAVRAQGTEFDSLREYVAGDDVRSIDWRATARAADVMVRTWRPERDRQVVLVLDSGRTSAARIGDETRLDILLDACLLLAALAGRAGDRVSFLAHDRTTRLDIPAGNGPSQLPRLVEEMATLEPALVETDSRGLVAAVLARLRKRALVVLFVALDRPAMEEGLLPALAPLTSRHTVVVAAVRPAPTAPAGVGPVAQAYDAAASAKAESDRALMRTRLARMGVWVVDAEPADIAPKLADTYLELKAAGKL